MRVHTATFLGERATRSLATRRLHWVPLTHSPRFAASGERLFAFTLLVHALEQGVLLTISPPGAGRTVFLADRAVPPVCSADPFAQSSLGSAPAPACKLSPKRTPGKTYEFNPAAACSAGACEQKLLGGGGYAVAWGAHSTAAGAFLLTVANTMPPGFAPQPRAGLQQMRQTCF